MPKYFYTARDKSGTKIQDFEEAPNQEDIITRLQARDLVVIDITPEFKEVFGLKREVVSKIRLHLRRYRIRTDDLAVFCRQLATLLGAGVTILKSLDIISQQVSSRKLYEVIKALQKDMEQGLSLHEAMAKHPKVFSDLWVNLVESGEASGNLAIVLNRLASYLERNAAFKNKIISALIYPFILFIAGIGALVFLTIKIIPVFADIFSGFDITLPLLTRILIQVSKYMRSYAIIIFLVGVFIFSIFKQFIRTKDGRTLYEKIKFKLPVLGEFFKALVVERFSSEMSTLIESGVPILYALEITEQSVGNLVVGEIIRKVKDEVRQGRSLSSPLDKSGFFEPMVIQMITVGEEIGELSQMFKKINVFYQDQVETFLIRFTAMFEPIILVFIGGVIGIMIVGMFLPIFQISQISG